jgi:hypothetical protein
MKNSKKVIIFLQGGLGNQMFQYAAGRCLSIVTNSFLYLDSSILDSNKEETNNFTPRDFELDIFKNINFPLIVNNNSKKKLDNAKKNSLRNLFYGGANLYEEPHFHFDPLFFKLIPTVYLKGYFNSENYFSKIRDILLQDFVFPEINMDSELELKNYILNKEMISVHIRRGDYLKPSSAAFHGFCSLDYYEQAIDIIRKKEPNSRICFFTDDPHWVKETIYKKYDYSILVEGNNGKNSWKDMFLMSLCKHHVIANSTFSWWGAWLSKYPKKIVVAPKKWFNDLSINTNNVTPDSWIRI